MMILKGITKGGIYLQLLQEPGKEDISIGSRMWEK